MLTKGYTVTIFCAMATLLLIYSVETTASSFPRYYYPNTSMSANSTENNSRKARFEISCDSNSSNNSTYFQNPNFPTTYTESRTCLASFRKVHSNICQFRLDFISFDIGKPTSGMCNEDRLIISGQSQNSVVPPLCGFNTGQHPPPNCLQYHTGVQGQFQSFNYISDVMITDQGYFNNLDYTICFRKEVGFCTMTYFLPEFIQPTNQQQQTQASPFFAIEMGAGGTNQQLTTAGAGMQDCPSDYIILASIRLCGGRLNDKLVNNVPASSNTDVIDTTTGPFLARFVTNSDSISRGFLINYRQNPCTSGR
ncbi:uncharacterized protein LOC143225462 isoform X2 [Tachypleus tridentatus]|uniref:uncharacterized protein LOC143225462 isoform X2 n=1 Tax=Tachypleus tridentatus TaxID=6853 RepID=UPI003FCF5CF8